MKNQLKIDGFNEALKLLKELDDPTRNRILIELRERDAQLTDRLLSQLFTFNDLQNLEPKEIQILFRESNSKELKIALRGISPDLMEKIKRSLSVRQFQLLFEEVELLGPKRKSEVDRARKEVLETAKKLEGEGKLLLQKRKSE